MALYFLYMKTFGRGSGSSAVGAAAYRAGERIRDERSGKVHDHSDRQDVLHKQIVLPSRWKDADMEWAQDRATLWNAVEAAENRGNARVAREILVALPAELPPEDRLQLVRGFAQDLADRHRFALDLAIHAPRHDPRNFHAHLLASTREILSTGFGSKTGLEQNDANRRALGLEPFYQELVATRERWAIATNEALQGANLAVRVDHRSLEAQGIDREPQPRLPRGVYEMQRRGEYNAYAERTLSQYAERQQQREERAPKAPPSLEDIRRQAREEWLRMRQGAAPERAQRQDALIKPPRGLDDEFTR